MVEALRQMASGALDPRISRTQLFRAWVAKNTEYGVENTGSFNLESFGGHVARCHRELWDAVQEARR